MAASARPGCIASPPSDGPSREVYSNLHRSRHIIVIMLPSSYSVALVMMLLCMIAWGSWTNCYRLARKWRLEFFHADWALGLFFTAVAASTFAAMPLSVEVR